MMILSDLKFVAELEILETDITMSSFTSQTRDCWGRLAIDLGAVKEHSNMVKAKKAKPSAENKLSD